jgi:hypothetical protein
METPIMIVPIIFGSSALTAILKHLHIRQRIKVKVELKDEREQI